MHAIKTSHPTPSLVVSTSTPAAAGEMGGFSKIHNFFIYQDYFTVYTENYELAKELKKMSAKYTTYEKCGRTYGYQWIFPIRYLDKVRLLISVILKQKMVLLNKALTVMEKSNLPQDRLSSNSCTRVHFKTSNDCRANLEDIMIEKFKGGR